MTTFENLPGVSIGDMGEKIGLNGVDNGYITSKFLYVSYHLSIFFVEL